MPKHWSSGSWPRSKPSKGHVSNCLSECGPFLSLIYFTYIVFDCWKQFCSKEQLWKEWSKQKKEGFQMLESRMLGLMPFLENRVSMCLEAQVLFYASLLVRFFLRWSLIFFSLKYPLLQRDSSFTWRLYGLSITPWTRELSNLKLLLSITEMKENKVRFWHKEGTPMSPWNQSNSIMFTDLKELIKPSFVMAKLICFKSIPDILFFTTAATLSLLLPD